MEGCSNASADIDKTVDEPASGHGVNTTITVAGSSSSSESLSIGMDLNRWPSMSVATLRMEVAGTGRSGGVTVFPVSFTVVR